MLKCAAYLLIGFTTSVALAQAPTGLYPFGSFDNLGFDTVDRGSLNVHFAIPVVSKAGRGMNFQYQIVYDSSVWGLSGTAGSQSWNHTPGWGFTGQLNGEGFEGYLSYVSTMVKCYQSGGSFFFTTNTSKYVYHDAFGANHPFTYAENTCTGVVTPGGPSSDGSGYSFSGNYVSDKSGRQINAPVLNQTSSGSITDANGNTITNNGSGTFTDTLGKTVLTISGSGTPSSPKLFTYSTPTGTAAVKVNYQTYTVQTTFGCSNVGPYNLSQNLVSSIQLADGSTYTFTYEPTPGYSGNVTGRIASITLPQGGTINYTYSGSNGGIICADGSAAGLARTGGVSRTYTRSSVTSTSSQTTVTDGLNNTSVYNFAIFGSPEAFYETFRSIYQGSSNGPLLLSQATCYNGATAPCLTTAVTQQVTQVDTYGAMNGEQAGSTLTYNTYGLLTGKTDYDYTASSTSHGTALRQETWTYPSSGIYDLVSQDQVKDPTNVIGLTTYAYDETTGAGHAPLVTTSGLPSHSAVSGQRGNLTTVNQYYNPNNFISATSAYEDTGNPVSVTGPAGATTYTWESTTHGFAYTVKPPRPSSNVDLPSYATYDLNSGVLLTTSDANSQSTTTYKTYSALLQPMEIDHPDGGTVLASYSPNSYGVQNSISGQAAANTQTSQDAFGRLNWVAVQNDAGGYYWNNYCYDGNGNLQYAAYRFAAVNQNNISCSGAGDSYAYDALGRVTTITHADGSVKTFAYTGRATKITDENGASRIMQKDGLGRMTAVCEISGNTQMDGTAPTSCGTDITGTGFVTSYVYGTDTGRANAQQVTVTQGAQNRLFETDFLGRTTRVQEPEASVTTYSYGYSTTSGLGLTVTRVRPTPNQSSASTTTTTTTQYDSVGRVVSVTYSDGTPAKTFLYDASVGWPYTQTNLVGRLSAHTRGTAAGSAASIYGYDAMGRVTLQVSCLPSGCGSTAYNHVVNYTWNWAGMLTSEGDGAGNTYTYGRTRAGEISSLVDSYSDSTDPANIITPGSVQNGPNGPTLYTMGNGLNVVNQYDTLGRLSAGFVCAGSTSASCSGGTQAYGFTAQRQGTHVTESCDTVLNVCNAFGYDEFDRLTSRTVNQGTAQNFTYAYDRYGNRWQQNAPQGGPILNITFNLGNNIINTSGFTNDVVGNVSNDTFHTYTYDPDGNLTAVDGGSTARYYYDSLDQRVQIAPTRGTYEFVWDIFGRRVSNWQAGNHLFVESNAYTDSGPIAIRAGGYRDYETQNWVGTERVRTSYNGAVSLSVASLPWADQHTPAGDNGDQHDFAGMDRDLEDSTEHAQYRQYATNLGRWLSPDQYLGSYDLTNPQSFNRYSYALNDPVNRLDSTGQDSCDISVDGPESCDGPAVGGGSDGCSPSCTDQNGTTYTPGANGAIVGEPTVVAVNGGGLPDMNADWSYLDVGSDFIDRLGSSNANAPNNVTLTPQAQGCQAKIQGAVNNALNTNSTFLGPTVGPGMNSMGYRNGAYNFNYFAPGVVNPVAGSNGGSGRFPGSGLHIPLPGGADPTIMPWGYNASAGGSYFTAHYDSANPTDDLISFFEHIINDVILRRAHGC